MAQIQLDDGKDPVLLRNYEFGWEMCWQRNKLDPDTKQVAETYWSPGKWYANLPQALNALAEMKLRNCDAKSLNELAFKIEGLRKELMSTYAVNIGGNNAKH
jgi:hypothetical protein